MHPRFMISRVRCGRWDLYPNLVDRLHIFDFVPTIQSRSYYSIRFGGFSALSLFDKPWRMNRENDSAFGLVHSFEVGIHDP